MWDIAIFGAGPAGSVAAHVLRRAGRRVLLVDPLREQKIKIGEALPGAALRILRALRLPTPDQSGRHNPIGGTLSCWGSEELIATDFLHDPDGPGWRLDRLQFDISLREAALGVGTTFERTRLAHIQRNQSTWRITLGNGKAIEALWVIDATGRNASVARQLGGYCITDSRLTALYSVGRPLENHTFNRTVTEAVPSGWWYGGILPSGAAILGFHFLPKCKNDLRPGAELWRNSLSQTLYIKALFPNMAFELQLIARDASAGCLNSPTGDGWIACGDAAICFDPISGQGILSAIHGGMSAGMAVQEALNGNASALGQYKVRLEAVQRTYRSRRQDAYASQYRWRNEEFWVRMRSTTLTN
jgi:flavin-dependent dehydrogenase